MKGCSLAIITRTRYSIAAYPFAEEAQLLRDIQAQVRKTIWNQHTSSRATELVSIYACHAKEESSPWLIDTIQSQNPRRYKVWSYTC